MGKVIREGKKLSENFKAYEDGKHRRYTLMFSVNGGAFAIANLIVPKHGPEVLGNLTLGRLAVGMIAFNFIMTYDIWTFGDKMRKNYVHDVFSWQGKTVLVAIGLLISAGWFLAGF